jgi:trehalose 6-phosphate synthase
MRALRRQVLTHDVDRWARSFLAALNPVDQHEPSY